MFGLVFPSLMPHRRKQCQSAHQFPINIALPPGSVLMTGEALSPLPDCMIFLRLRQLRDNSRLRQVRGAPFLQLKHAADMLIPCCNVL